MWNFLGTKNKEDVEEAVKCYFIYIDVDVKLASIQLLLEQWRGENVEEPLTPLKDQKKVNTRKRKNNLEEIDIDLPNRKNRPSGKTEKIVQVIETDSNRQDQVHVNTNYQSADQTISESDTGMDYQSSVEKLPSFQGVDNEITEENSSGTRNIEPHNSVVENNSDVFGIDKQTNDKNKSNQFNIEAEEIDISTSADTNKNNKTALNHKDHNDTDIDYQSSVEKLPDFILNIIQQNRDKRRKNKAVMESNENNNTISNTNQNTETGPNREDHVGVDTNHQRVDEKIQKKDNSGAENIDIVVKNNQQNDDTTQQDKTDMTVGRTNEIAYVDTNKNFENDLNNDDGDANDIFIGIGDEEIINNDLNCPDHADADPIYFIDQIMSEQDNSGTDNIVLETDVQNNNTYQPNQTDIIDKQSGESTADNNNKSIVTGLNHKDHGDAGTNYIVNHKIAEQDNSGAENIVSILKTNQQDENETNNCHKCNKNLLSC
ncbi:uncharacterized protein DDB_G0290685-like [Aphidius gifuensis]|uniref:uncharacterized protein DDB_G0290685-like n=1 Tax=Aphidius gifuensis TaxID=684658 RepID=UPI001CDC3B4D|nr:uncharacterized protein DDB_G0290685-like [Aphidius gifuensis]